ncbi:MAG: hypothetical protein ACI9RI_001656 [Oceanospirillaceae bacterium]|jgi:hypothetical protein|tara:strand:- start:278 stop:406 length:129 start_codon:yes stop_codon:yes gene_type:complete
MLRAFDRPDTPFKKVTGLILSLYNNVDAWVVETLNKLKITKR